MTAAPHLVTSGPPVAIAEDLSVALIGPDERVRNLVAITLSGYLNNPPRQFISYPKNTDELLRMLDQHYDVVVVELDSDPERALELVENICVETKSTVMVYSSRSDTDMLVRCMRAGAREFLSIPLESLVVVEALQRASDRRPASAPRTAGKLLVFMGAKGGVGVTSVACNFAVALAQDPSHKTLLIDLDLPLGDAGLNLGIVAEYSTVNALQSVDRLDGSFLTSLLVKHSSGLSVLPAPGKFPDFHPTDQAIKRLVDVSLQEFDNVVVDVGSRLDLQETVLFSRASTIYLVTQAGIPELRNANRLIKQVFSSGGPNLEIVLNRFESKTIGISEEHITDALTRPARWKVPNDHPVVRNMQINGSPLVLGDSAVARMIREMAQSVIGEADVAPEAPVKKKGFSFFR